jgi:hypothetical protein
VLSETPRAELMPLAPKCTNCFSDDDFGAKKFTMGKMSYTFLHLLNVEMSKMAENRKFWGTGYFLWVRLSLSQNSEYSEHEEGNIVDTSQVSPKDFYF